MCIGGAVGVAAFVAWRCIRLVRAYFWRRDENNNYYTVVPHSGAPRVLPCAHFDPPQSPRSDLTSTEDSEDTDAFATNF